MRVARRTGLRIGLPMGLQEEHGDCPIQALRLTTRNADGEFADKASVEDLLGRREWRRLLELARRKAARVAAR